ncbi:MAG: ABC transporter permease, partial [Actinobacteria bacterium]|nr:ABC transporter permease [Actinomycetota bacterium]
MTVAAWFVFQALIPRGTPAGIVLQGVILGGLNALLAIGIVLVYRTNRIVNFAQGELGGTAAVFFVLLNTVAGVPFVLAAIAGLIVSMVLSALVDIVVIRRFESSSRLLPTVATIGIAQLFGFTTLLLPTWFGRVPSTKDFQSPLSRFTFTVNPLPFDGNGVLVLIVVAGVSIGLARFMQTRYGIGIRATAENPERAALVGVPTRRLSTIVWALAGLLAGMATMLQAPIVGLTLGSLIGPALLLRALAAAVVGRMYSLPVTVATAIGLGVFEQAVYWAYGRTAIVDLLLVVVILGGLFLQRGRVTRAERGGAGAFQGVTQVRPIPSELADLPEVRWGRVALGGAVAAIVIVVPLTVGVSRASLLAVVAIYAIVALSLVVLTGWSGQISLGQFALVGVGAGFGGSATQGGQDFVVAILVGMFAGMLAAILLGLPALRLTGFYLAVTTLAFAVATHSWLLGQAWARPEGVIPRPMLFSRWDLESEHTYYFLCLGVLALTILMLRGLRNSRVGRAIVAVRDNSDAAQAYGIKAVLAKLGAFAISGGTAGVAGALLVHQQHGLQPAQYSPAESLQAFAMTVIGGLGSVPGALAGAIYVKGSQNILQGGYALLATGLGMTLILLVLPQGLGSLLFRLRDMALRSVARRRGIVVASLLEDRRVDEPERAIDDVSFEDVMA